MDDAIQEKTTPEIGVRVALGMFGATAVCAGLNGQLTLAGANALLFLAAFAAKKVFNL